MKDIKIIEDAAMVIVEELKTKDFCGYNNMTQCKDVRNRTYEVMKPLKDEMNELKNDPKVKRYLDIVDASIRVSDKMSRLTELPK